MAVNFLSIYPLSFSFGRLQNGVETPNVSEWRWEHKVPDKTKYNKETIFCIGYFLGKTEISAAKKRCVLREVRNIGTDGANRQRLARMSLQRAGDHRIM